MALTVNTNVASLQAQGRLQKTQKGLEATLRHISSGLRVGSAADDAAGLGVATNLDTDAGSGRYAIRNINDGVSIIQTAESAAEEMVDIIQRMRELAIQAASESLQDTERGYINDEYDQLQQEITRISDVTEFNGFRLMNGQDTELQVQVGLSSTAQITVRLQDIDSSELGIGTLSMTSATGAQAALDSLDSALDTLNQFRSGLGAAANRLDHALSIMSAYVENVEAASSQIIDADFAFETAEMTKYQIMQQAGIAALAQARQINQGVVSLLG